MLDISDELTDKSYNNIVGSLKGLDVTQASKKLKDLKINPQLATDILDSASSLKILTGSADEVSDGIKKMSSEAAESAGTLSNIGNIFKGLGSELKAFFLNPTTWAIAGGAIAAFALLSAETFDTLSEQAAKSQSEYESTKAELDSLNSELETTSSRIKELQTQGALTLTEQGELENLQKTEESLKRQIDLKDKLAQKQGDKASKDAAKALNKKGIIDLTIDEKLDANSSKRELSEAYKDSDIVSATKNEVKALEEYYSSKEKLEKEYNEKSTSTDRKKEINTKLSDIEANIDRYEDSLSDKIKKIEPLYQDLLNPDTGEAKKGSENLAGQIEKIIDDYNSLGSTITEKQAKALSEIWKNDSFAQAQQKLVDAFRDGEDISIDDITNQFPELVAACEESGISVEMLRDELSALSEQGDAATAIENSIDNIKASITDAISNIETLKSVLSESVSGAGISTENVAAFREMFGDDAEYALERTANGFHINKKALAELQEQQEQMNKTDYLSALSEQYQMLRDVNLDIVNAKLSGNDTSGFESSRDGILSQITSLQDLQMQYEAASSAYQQWQNAMSGGEEGDMYDSIFGNMDSAKELYDKGLTGTQKFREFVDLMSNQDLSTASGDEIVAAYESALPKMQRYFTEGQDGARNFLSDIQSINSEWAHMNDDGSWDINFGMGNDQEVADALGIDVEAVQSIMRKLSDYNFDINLDRPVASLEELKVKAEEAQGVLGEDLEVNLNAEGFDNVSSEIEKVQSYIDEIKESDISPDVKADKLQEANAILEYFNANLEQSSSEGSINVDINMSLLESGIEDLNTLKAQLGQLNSENSLLTIEGKVVVQDNIDETIARLQAQPVEVQAALNIEGLSSEEIKQKVSAGEIKIPASISDIDTSKLTSITAPLNVKANITGNTPKDESKSLTYNATIVGEKPKDESKSLIYNISTSGSIPGNKTRTLTYEIKTKGSVSPANGTAHSSGSAYYHGSAFSQGSAMWQHYRNASGKAYAGGNWGLQRNQNGALINELGGEIIVRDGQWHIINNGYPALTDLKQGDIIFNHKQSNEILKNGYVTGSHAKLAYSGGSAFSSGSGKFNIGGSGSKSYSSVTKKKSSPSTPKTNSAQKSAESAAKALEEVIDWMAILLDRVNRQTEIAVDNIGNAIGLVNKQSATANAISKVQNEISKNQAASNRYMQEANSVGLSSNYASKVRDGSLNIETITDEDLKKKITDYQKYYEAALKCEDEVRKLQEQENELAQRRLENIEEYYDAVTKVNKAMQDVLESRKDFNDALGTAINHDMNISDIKDAIKSQTDTYNQLVQKLTDYQAEFNSLVANGYLPKGSDAWYEGQEKINKFTSEVYDASKALIEYQDKLNQIEYDRLKYLIDGFDRAVSKLDKYASLLESRDEAVPESIYKEQMDTNNNRLQTIKSLRDKKLEEQKFYDVNSTRYQDLAKEISELDDEALGLMEDNQKLKDNIFEVRIKPIEDAIKGYEKLDNEISDFLDLLNEDAYFDRKGRITEEALAALALTQQGMANLKQKVADLRTGLDKLQESYDNGVISETEYNEKSEEYRDNIRDTVADIKDYEKALTDLYMKQLTQEVDALDETIDKYKEAQRRQAEYWEYGKKLNNQQKSVDLLKSQIAALEGVNNATAQAELKRLKAELATEQESLDDIKRDHKNDMIEQGYDKISDDMHQMLEDTEYEIAHNAEKQQRVISSMLQNVVGMYQSAYDKINSIIGNTGWVGSTDFNDNQTQLGTQEGATSQNQNATQTQPNVNPSDVATGTVTDKIDNNDSFNNQLEQEIMQKPNTDNRPVAELKANPTSLTLQEGKSSSISTSIRPTDAKNKTLSWKSSNTSIATVSGGTVKALKPGTCQVVVSTTDGSGLTVTIGVTVTKKPDPPKPKPTPNPSTGGDGIARVGDVVTYSGRYYYDSWGKRPAGNLYSGVSRGVVIDSYSGKEYGGKSSSHGGYGVHIKSADGRYGDLGWVSLSQLTGYKTGTKSVDKDKLAWTQEGGREMIIRPNGDMLTPLGQGDAVVPNKLTENLWEWGTYNPHEVIRNAAVPNVDYRGGGVVNIEQHYDSLLKVEGNVDKDALPGLKELLEKSYQYNINKMTRECIKTNGIKRRR